MYSKDLLLLFTCLGLLGGLHLTSTTTTTTFVAAMSIGNQDLERYFRTTNATQAYATMTEDRIALDLYTYAFLNYSYVEGGETFNDGYGQEKARYGEGKIMNVKGKLVHISNAESLGDDTACSPNILGTLGAPTPPLGTPWIALVRRGGCTFEEKVQHVYAQGASGVIIYNDRMVVNLEKMQIKGQQRNITAVITYQDIGVDMARRVDSGIDVIAMITAGRSGSRPINSLNRTSVLFVSISFIVLMVISLVWLIFYYIQRFRYLQTKDQQSRHLCSVTKKAIMKIPTKTGKSSDEKDLDSDCCAICIETYKPSDCIRVLPCKHEFHKNCIDPWLIEHRTCPMCKLDVLKFYGYVFLGSEESILEYEPDRNANAAGAAGTTANTVTALQQTQVSHLLRSRDFVIDFPRIFVLDAGGATGTRESLFPARLPERSQSSMSLANAKDWMSNMSNKLDEQHGLRRFRKNTEMEEHLLNTRSDSLKKRRSRSADGRYSSGFFARQKAAAAATVTATATDEEAAIPSTSSGHCSRGMREEYDVVHERRRHSIRRGSDIPLSELRIRNIQSHQQQQQQERNRSRDTSPTRDVVITIQVNGEGVDLE